jgi:hypothetical protein
MLSRIAHSGWHVTLAIPNLDAWVTADPRVKAIFDSNEATKTDRYLRAARIVGLAQERPLDRKAIGLAHPEFLELLRFVSQYEPVPLT